jgi:ribosomal protein L37AE/L43A
LRAKLLEVVRIMYQHYPRPKEFIMKYRIQVGVWVCAACGVIVTYSVAHAA